MSGMGHGPYTADMSRVATDNITIYGTWSGTGDYMDEVFDRIRDGSLQVEAIISHIFPLAEWRRAFDTLLRREGLKILLDPSPPK